MIDYIETDISSLKISKITLREDSCKKIIKKDDLRDILQFNKLLLGYVVRYF